MTSPVCRQVCRQLLQRGGAAAAASSRACYSGAAAAAAAAPPAAAAHTLLLWPRAAPPPPPSHALLLEQPHPADGVWSRLDFPPARAPCVGDVPSSPAPLGSPLGGTILDVDGALERATEGERGCCCAHVVTRARARTRGALAGARPDTPQPCAHEAPHPRALQTRRRARPGWTAASSRWTAPPSARTNPASSAGSGGTGSCAAWGPPPAAGCSRGGEARGGSPWRSERALAAHLIERAPPLARRRCRVCLSRFRLEAGPATIMISPATCPRMPCMHAPCT